MYQTYANGTEPTAHITFNRGRLKTYGDKVYLKNGSNFEIELHNPTQSSVLAKIFINGAEISQAGLIVRPGQRIYLERFIDDSKKLTFNTYEVENTSIAKSAIESNGKIKVYFYPESKSRVYSQPLWYNHGIFTNDCSSGGWSPSSRTACRTYVPKDNVFYSSSLSNGTTNSATITSTCGSFDTSLNSLKSIETGRIEKGQDSGQVFETANGTFEYFYSACNSWQILPESSKPIESSDIRSYCTKCGTKHKKTSWKFCPTCGTPVNE